MQLIIYYIKNIYIITVLINFAITYSIFTAYNIIEIRKCFFVIITLGATAPFISEILILPII